MGNCREIIFGLSFQCQSLKTPHDADLTDRDKTIMVFDARLDNLL